MIAGAVFENQSMNTLADSIMTRRYRVTILHLQP